MENKNDITGKVSNNNRELAAKRLIKTLKNENEQLKNSLEKISSSWKNNLEQNFSSLEDDLKKLENKISAFPNLKEAVVNLYKEKEELEIKLEVLKGIVGRFEEEKKIFWRLSRLICQGIPRNFLNLTNESTISEKNFSENVSLLEKSLWNTSYLLIVSFTIFGFYKFIIRVIKWVKVSIFRS